jgi:hypothetical protein
MNVDPERIKERMIALGHDPAAGGQTWLAKEVGMKPQGIQSILAGEVQRPRKLREISQALKTTDEFLLGEGRHSSEVRGPSPEMAIRLAELFAGLMRANGDLQYQIANYIEKRLEDGQGQLRETATKQAP